MSHEIDREGFQIARMLDSSQPHRAADRLREDLYEMDPRDFVDLVRAVNYYDRKGMGADLQVRSLGSRGPDDESLVSVVQRPDDRFGRQWPPYSRGIREDVAIIRERRRFVDDDDSYGRQRRRFMDEGDFYDRLFP